jgi:outer membrane biosynthesis protein TonB
VDAVTEVLIDRARDQQKLSRMVVVSLLLHGMLITALTVLPQFRHAPPPTSYMTIVLGGTPGPQQGRTPTSAKEVQEVAKPAAKPTPEAPPALRKPDMVEPVKAAKPETKAAAKPEAKKETPQLHGSKPTTGPEPKAGIARVETHGAAIPFGGLSTGGGGGGGAYTDIKNFCCPEYLTTVTDIIHRNWQQNQQQDGSSVVAFTIQRDGSISDVAVEQGANPMLNLVSQRAIAATRQVPPLPAAYTNDHLTVHLAFQYQR